MKVLVDTNVILDVLCNRKEFVADSLRVFQCCETQHITGYISALSIPNIVYIMQKFAHRGGIPQTVPLYFALNCLPTAYLLLIATPAESGRRFLRFLFCLFPY